MVSYKALNTYIKYEQAKDIMRFIRLYGKITGEEELMSTGIFSVDEMAKLRPYLDFDVRHWKPSCLLVFEQVAL